MLCRSGLNFWLFIFKLLYLYLVVVLYNQIAMLKFLKKIFKTTTELEKVKIKYIKAHNHALKEAYNLSKTNRKASDEKYAEADAIAKELELLIRKAEDK